MCCASRCARMRLVCSALCCAARFVRTTCFLRTTRILRVTCYNVTNACAPHTFTLNRYCCFYLPGWPVSFIQRRWDEGYDLYFSSSSAFLVRPRFLTPVAGGFLSYFFPLR